MLASALSLVGDSLALLTGDTFDLVVWITLAVFIAGVVRAFVHLRLS